VVVLTPGKPARCDFSRAISSPPSGGAVALLVWAAENRTAFFKDLVPKTLSAEKTEEEGQVAEDLQQVEKIRGILKRYQQVARERFERELIENAPLALWDEARNCLSGWERDSGVELPVEARASLEAHVTDLCNRVQAASLATAASRSPARRCRSLRLRRRKGGNPGR